jgi:hypothetical protein
MDIEALKEQVISCKLFAKLRIDCICSGQRLRIEMGSALAGTFFLALAWSVNGTREKSKIWMLSPYRKPRALLYPLAHYIRP